MENERKDTILRDKYGDYHEWVKCILILTSVCLVIMFIFTLISIPIAIHDYYEVEAFNRIHGTDYTFGEWFWAGRTIKDYHLGTVENKNIQVDLNIEGLDLSKS